VQQGDTTSSMGTLTNLSQLVHAVIRNTDTYGAGSSCSASQRQLKVPVIAHIIVVAVITIRMRVRDASATIRLMEQKFFFRSPRFFFIITINHCNDCIESVVICTACVYEIQGWFMGWSMAEYLIEKKLSFDFKLH